MLRLFGALWTIFDFSKKSRHLLFILRAERWSGWVAFADHGEHKASTHSIRPFRQRFHRLVFPLRIFQFEIYLSKRFAKFHEFGEVEWLGKSEVRLIALGSHAVGGAVFPAPKAMRNLVARLLSVGNPTDNFKQAFSRSRTLY